MYLSNNDMYVKDILKAIDANRQLLNLRKKAIFITGSTGLICSTIVDVLLVLNRFYGTDIKIYAGARDINKFNSRFDKDDNLHFVMYDANEKINFHEKVDFIIHGASNASPDLYVNNPVETMLTNFIGMKNLLNLGLNQKVEKCIYISSSEVYGKIIKQSPLKEDEYGELDILSTRMSYSSSKRATETLCSSYSEEYGLNISIVRPGHVYGPAAKNTDNRVVSSFIRDVVNGKNLILRSKGEQIRSYMYSVDCASAILYVLLNGRTCEAYNISNEKSIITIKQMADILCHGTDSIVEYKFNKISNNLQDNPMINSSLNNKKLKGLSWRGMFDPYVGLSHTVLIKKELDGSK